MISKRPIPLDALVSFIENGAEKPFCESGIGYVRRKLLTERIEGIQEPPHRRMTSVSNKDMELNYFYLIHECKINANDIETLPNILLHDPATLKLYWNKLVTDTKPEVLSRLYEKPERLLNLLQYYLEKSLNFRYIYVLKDSAGERRSRKR